LKLKEAKAIRGATKFSERAAPELQWSANNRGEREQIQFLGSMSLAKSTWSNYNTAEALFRKCCKEKGLSEELPVREDTVVSFVLWLAFDREVSSATISNYLAGLRNAHIVRGLECPKIRSEKVELLIRGKKNWEEAKKREAGDDERRKPVTPDILRLLKARINETEMGRVDRRLVWSVCTVLFFGAFRGGEILCKSETSFDPAFTLLSEDVRARKGERKGERILEFSLKAPKESKAGKVIVVDVYQSVEELCPVRAYEKWKQEGGLVVKGQPAFRWADGRPLTPAALNILLKSLLKGFMPGAERWFTVHSFRTGAASWLGSVGMEDEEVKALGRWSSRAFEEYMRLPRTKRRAVAKVLSREMD
jgi:hypothetical protein